MISTSVPVDPAPEGGLAMLRGIDLTGPAGRLEALLNEGAADAPYAALVCHPHPKGGGTLHNRVVYRAMKALNAPEFGLGWPVLRFNFRGTGLSEGEHDGRAESGDVLAALDWLENEYRRPLVVVGFSFGAAMALHACCGGKTGNELRAKVQAVVALGLPTQAGERHYHYSFLRTCSFPKLFLSGDCDQYAPAADLRRVAATTAEPKKLVFLPGANHFFAGQLEAMQNILASWLMEQLQ
jgi:alpha/beta superfamily hydrolase